jgi:hypothetical protein
MHQATPPVYQEKNCLQPAYKFIGLQYPHNFLDQTYFMTIGSLVLRSKGGSDFKKYEMTVNPWIYSLVVNNFFPSTKCIFLRIATK